METRTSIVIDRPAHIAHAGIAPRDQLARGHAPAFHIVDPDHMHLG